ncbi:MAG: Alpha-D-ribose 1-methylphosphonate 5-triphosphate synthase subunit PhnI [Firmicutes bacterium]|nr:Alpha-D-ribose 1-methylphosphonate 5-triphosphate synthase subunit PhnI [Bacillota bacterium]
MAYVAVKGGEKAIKEAERLAQYFRCRGDSAPIAVRQIQDQMRLAVDRVMGEGGLYAPELAALALKQSEGDTLEAAFLLRAFSSTLPRRHYSLPADSSDMRIMRRISSAFKDIPGGQFLGPTKDYTQRLMAFDLLEENSHAFRAFVSEYVAGDVPDRVLLTQQPRFPKVVDLLRLEGLLADPAVESPANYADLTRQAIRFPATRSMRLQALARGENGSMLALAYSSMRGYGAVHPCIGELRVGHVELLVPHPLDPTEIITVGEVLLTEVELVARMRNEGKGSVAQLTLGYGVCFGHNEVKAIAMATLDRSMTAANPGAPAEDEEFVLYHIDGIESAGFAAHWKLPHYVDFQADLNRLRSVVDRRGKANDLL